MKVLITGSAGQLGRALVGSAPAGADVHCVDLAECDLADAAAITALVAEVSPDLVINAAAYTAVDKAESEPEIALAVNGAAPGAMAQAAAERGLPFLHISTDYVFDGTGTAPWSPKDPVGPLGAYGRTKLAGEEAVRAAGGTHAILRTSWVVSAHGANFVKTMLRLSETREVLTVVADQIGGPTPAAAIADALFAMAGQLAADPSKSGTYHFSGAPDVSWADFAREIFAQAGRATRVEDIPTSAYPTPAKRPSNSRLDCSGLAARFGIARPDWRAGLTDILTELGALA